jgi:hypothetical protein
LTEYLKSLGPLAAAVGNIVLTLLKGGAAVLSWMAQNIYLVIAAMVVMYLEYQRGKKRRWDPFSKLSTLRKIPVTRAKRVTTGRKGKVEGNVGVHGCL